MESAAALVESLKKHGILEAPRLAEVAHLETRFTDPRGLGRELVQRGWITPFQINRLLQDRSQDLVLGSYVLLEQLGQGGMGQVFKARHRRLDRIDAVKVIRKEYLDRPNALERFEREARAAARLAHPNVITVYDAGETGGGHFLAMEYAPGVDLARLVKQSGPLPIVQACDYIRQAALGLQHVHERRLIHRDIKPSNLLLTPDGTVKLLDLGLARIGALADATAPSLTDTGTVVGTADFIAPEQARDSRDVDIRADIYSLGCTLYYLLTGKIPFPGETLTAKLLAHQLEEAAPIESLRPDVPPGLVLVVRRLMAKQPAERWQTPAEVAAALQPFAQGGTAPAAVPVLEHSLLLTPASSDDHGPGLAATSLVTAATHRPAVRQRGLVLAMVGAALALTALFVCGGLALLFLPGKPSQGLAAAPTSSKERPPITIDKTQARVHLERGAAWQNGREWDKAIAEYTLALSFDADSGAAHNNRGECYRGKGDHDAAIRDYTRAIELNPQLPEPYFNRASSFYAKGDVDRCLADNSASIKLRPNYAPGYNNRGAIYTQKKLYSEAIRDFSEAIRLNDRYAAAYHNRGTAYLDIKQYGPALADLDRAISLDPTAANSFQSRGMVYHARGAFEKALADYNRAVELAPKFALAYFHRGQTYAKQGNAERAEADRRQAVQLDPALANER